MKVVVGLGNPGKRYEWTRHNIGSLVIDAILKDNPSKHPPKKGKSFFEFVEVQIDNETLVLAKPSVYMNESGVAIKAIHRQFEIDSSNCLVAVDDVYLPLGKLRFRPSGTSGGHKGLESIIRELNTEQFPRLRVGVGLMSDEYKDLSDFVLASLGAEERKVFIPEIIKAAEAALSWVRGGSEAISQKYN